ncbi:MAG: transcription-repair coupling factor [Bacilli bacterium]|nr:transcription-repair coupling factor [Bacilli bacterium]
MNNLFNMFNIKYQDNLGLSGLTDESFCLLVEELFRKEKQSILIVCSSLTEANNLLNILTAFNNDTLFFPMDDFLTSEAISISPDLMVTRLETLNELIKDTKKIVITHMLGYLRYLPSKKTYQDNILTLKVGDEFDIKELIEKLLDLGYKRETLVTKTGEVGIRGFIIDLFPVSSSHPIRIEFFGDEIESIRLFDEDTQKKIEEIKEFTIYPYTEFLLDNYSNLKEDERRQKYLPNYSSDIKNIVDYLNNPITIVKDYTLIINTYEKMLDEINSYKENDKNYQGNYMFPLTILDKFKVMHYLSIDNLIPNHEFKEYLNFNIKAVNKFHENIDIINNYLKEAASLGKQIIICLKDYQVKNFTKYLDLNYLLTTPDKLTENLVNIINFDLPKGFTYQNKVILTDKDLFNISPTKKKYKTKFKYATKISNINKLEVGDYIVHSINGIGIYNGIKTLNVQNLKKDFLEILYKDDDKLYIPVEKIELISKYSGKEGVIPKINGLGSLEWKKNKQRIISKVKDIADKLIRLYAEREMQKGFAFSEDTKYHEEFYQEFMYTPTTDQLESFELIKKEMERDHPMDMLLCGDVGFGKTEVAFRAMFKAVYDNKQVLYLCPTTILSNQQYQNALNRFKNFPVNIELLNRFTTPKKTKEILEKLEKGTVDIVIGTHRLLGKDIKPQDLGLLVIDEEQRFGVTHKEKLKQYKSNVDVLTLTATPIPRTLQMSIIGIRSLSVIKTPPVNRFPVQTYVVYESDQLIKDAIVKEMLRDGQVFILYNRVETIEEKMIEIQKLVPNARIMLAHGRLTKVELEDRMLKFINHEYDILLCTTIIETGIDIPNVNTLIVLDANRFGLSQLYQIRGRVGRSNKVAYAYLMYPEHKVLTEESVKRLNVLKEFTELGSGFNIANRDLSIRGAGDILGSEQSGFIDTVGIDLYLKILNDEVKRLKGEKIIEEEIKDEKPLISVSTYIGDQYTSDSELKIEIHKMINTIDSYPKLLSIKEEFEDRFGQVNEEILIYMHEEWFEKLAKLKGIEEVKQSKNEIELIYTMDETKKINSEELFMKSYKICRNFKFSYHNLRLHVTLSLNNLERHPIYYLIELINDENTAN